jgi:hypothetical protein
LYGGNEKIRDMFGDIIAEQVPINQRSITKKLARD